MSLNFIKDPIDIANIFALQYTYQRSTYESVQYFLHRRGSCWSKKSLI